MKTPLLKLMAAAAALGVTSAHALTIVPTYDSSIAANANAVGITNAIKYAIGVLQSNIVDNVTVKIMFVADESVGLGQSETAGNEYAYSDFLTALRSHAVGSRDINALSKIPNATVDPLIGGSQIHLTSAQARVLGLDSSAPDSDSKVSCKMSLMNFTRPSLDPDKYDLSQVLEHEINEVLGISSSLPVTNEVWPADLFRYTTNLARAFTTNGDDAYFSTDGTNLLARYNMDSGGDYGDWWSVNYPANWSPLTGVVTNHAQVQDAFSGPNNILDEGPAELAILDVVGWTLVTPPAPGPVFNIVRTGVNQYKISWTSTDNTLVLQERADLRTGNWSFSSSGSVNPAILTSTASQKFYRLYKPVIGTSQPARPAVVTSVATGPWTITTRRLAAPKP
ncbi:MAG TPA: NF038122 family metalloprotease [Verrucomicrobiae bacterium]|nr:NF038122 family metalloprotease [Verrucomicrobiae bacterium]